METSGDHARVLEEGGVRLWPIAECDPFTCGEVCLLGICLCGEVAAERGGGW